MIDREAPEPLYAQLADVLTEQIRAGELAPRRMIPSETTLAQTYGVNRPTTDEPALSGSWADYICLRNGTTVVRLPDEIDSLAAMAFACASS